MTIIKNPNTGTTSKLSNDSDSKLSKHITELKSLHSWQKSSVKKRINSLIRFTKILERNKEKLSDLISTETGKPFWESQIEISAAIGKINSTIKAYEYRCNYPIISTETKKTCTIIKPIGCIGIIGPYNFPIHIPHGQIIPALLTGNTVIVKPSEYCINTTKYYETLWKKCFGNEPSPIKFIYGDAKIGKKLVSHKDIDFIYFTGSYNTGRQIESVCYQLRKPVALEMGGNNALIIEDNHPEIINHLIMSAFITAGQRCSCARRIIINKKHIQLIDHFIEKVKGIKIDKYPSKVSPFMGPVVIESIKKRILETSFSKSETLLKAKDFGKGNLISPRIELTKKTIDEELFGPIVFLFVTDSFEESIAIANEGSFGLTASIYTKSKQKFNVAIEKLHSGIINWNNPTTGASGLAPFGGVKNSGNYRPGGFNMIDHCIIPIGTSQSKHIQKITGPGL